MKSVLVSGASGLIGRHCLPLLAAKGYQIHAVRRHRRSAPIPDVTGLSWRHLDLLQPGRPTELIRELRPDGLLHLAWCGVLGKFWETPENIDWLRASLELVSAFAESGGRRIVAAGSCAEYAPDSGECVEDQTPLAPTTLYGTCKRALDEILHRSTFRTASAACGRVFFLYGPYQDPSRVIAYVINSLLKGEPALCSEGRDVLDFLHVEDVASALVALLESEIRGPVNIGSGIPVALKDVFEEIGRQVGRPELIRMGARAAAPSQKSRIWANTAKLRGVAGWAPRYDLSRGIAQTVEWWRKQDSNTGPAGPDRRSQDLSPV